MDSKNIIANPPPNYNIDPRGMGRIYYDCMLKHQDKVAQICGFTGKTLKYREILQQAKRIAITLQNRGVKPGHVISVSMYNHMQCSAIVAAGFFIGAVVVGIDEDLPTDELSSLLEQITPKVIFAVDEVLESITNAAELINLDIEIVLVDSSNTDYTAFDTYVQPQTDENLFEPYSVKSLEDVAMIFFTSGTTGVPKGVFRSHLSLLTTHYNVMICNFCWDVIMDPTTPAWTVHLNYMSIAIILGTTRLIYKYIRPEDYWQFTRHKVTIAFLTVHEAVTMCQVEKPKGTDLGHLKTILIGGNILTKTKLDKIKKGFPGIDVYNVYGLTETGSISAYIPRDDYDRKMRCSKELSIGRGFPGVNFKIIDLNDGTCLGPNKNGEVRILVTYSRGDYSNYGMSDLYDEDGWFKTGDLGYYDEDGCIFIIDRIKEVFKYKIYRIVPSSLEDVILRHPAVDVAFVTGIPHFVDVEHPLAVVTLKSGCENVTCKELQEFVDENVPDYCKLRAGVKIIDKFPITHSGKIRRKLVRSWVAEGKI